MVDVSLGGKMNDGVDAVLPQQILEADDHGCFESHAERFMHHIHDADAAAVSGRLHLDETLGVDAEVAGAPAFKPKMLLGLRSGPGG